MFSGSVEIDDVGLDGDSSMTASFAVSACS